MSANLSGCLQGDPHDYLQGEFRHLQNVLTLRPWEDVFQSIWKLIQVFYNILFADFLRTNIKVYAYLAENKIMDLISNIHNFTRNI